METLDFLRGETKEQLAALGYFDISEERMKQIKKDLLKVTEHCRSTTENPSAVSSNSCRDSSRKFGTIRRSQQSEFCCLQPRIKQHREFVQSGELLKLEPFTAGCKIVPTAERESKHKNSRSEINATDLTTESVSKRTALRKQIVGTACLCDKNFVKNTNLQSHWIHELSLDDFDPRLRKVPQKQQLPRRPRTARPSWKKDCHFDAFPGRYQPTSFIRANTTSPYTFNLNRNNPAKRYQQYKDYWKKVVPPGESCHEALRQKIKAEMMYKDDLPQRKYAPNIFTMRTNRKRSALRREVRYAIENGFLPIPETFNCCCC